MGSRKPSAKKRQVEAFRSQLGGYDAAYERIKRDRAKLDERREAGYRAKSCESKNRYATRAEAQDAIATCAAYGRTGLSSYRCPYCKGWHLTSHPQPADV